MTYEHDALISEFSHERHRSRPADALHTLRKIASLVKPIMRQRGWRVGTLAEFYPSQQNLLGLNINRGQKICLRLRYATDDNQFLPIENVIDTMLHELAHNVFGPHDGKFHALWDQLRDEYEALARKGYTGEGFLSEGKRLGGRGGVGTGASTEEARRQVRATEALRRARNAKFAAGSGQKLGGRPVGWNQDIREVIASAVDRRKAITEGCGRNIEREETRRGIEEEVNRNGFRTKAEEDEANERAIMQAYMELVQEEEKERLGELYVEATAENPAGSRGATLPAAGKSMGSMLPPSAPPVPLATKPLQLGASSTSKESAASSTSDGWACSICTLFNQPNHLCCDACGTERPSSTIASDIADFGMSDDNNRKRPRTNGSRSSASTSRVLKPRSNQEAIDRIYAASEASKLKPVGWLCNSCGNFMEAEWWTCAQCGRMKDSSS